MQFETLCLHADDNVKDEWGTITAPICQAAYTYGDEWLEQLKVYLVENIAFVRQYLKANMPKVKLYEPEGTYLLWLDFSAYGLTDEQLEKFIEKKAGVWLDGGYVFGEGGSGFQRINVACPRSILKEALERIYAAFNGLNQ